MLNAGIRDGLCEYLVADDLELNAGILLDLLTERDRDIPDTLVKISGINYVEFTSAALAEFELGGCGLGLGECCSVCHRGLGSFGLITRRKKSRKHRNAEDKDTNSCFFHNKPHFIGLFSIYSSSIRAASLTASRQGRLE